MPCTTILVGKKATHDGSTLVGRNEDSMNGEFTPKRMAVILPDDQPRTYESVISHCRIELPHNPMRYTSMPNALEGEGIWGAAGINEAKVGMNATETITSNERVLAVDPLVTYKPAQGKPGTEGYVPEVAGGIGEEDMVTLVLPYVRTAREGVLRLGALLQQYGTYEMNGIAFHDANEVWWLETIGGHHWIARRVPDDCYVTMANQLGIDRFDLADARSVGIQHLCSPDLKEFMHTNHLDLMMRDGGGRSANGEGPDVFNPRIAFGSATNNDHVYNTPRAWAIQRLFNPRACTWDGAAADFGPESDDLPWCRIPARKLTVEDLKQALSLHYEGTPYDPYGHAGMDSSRGKYRCIGINRTSQLCVTQIRESTETEDLSIQWIAFGSNPFNALVPLFSDVEEVPAYFANTEEQVSTESFYWANRLIGALADAHYAACIPLIERYSQDLVSKARHILMRADADGRPKEKANAEVAQLVRTLTDKLLGDVLYAASMGMKNAYSRSEY